MKNLNRSKEVISAELNIQKHRRGKGGEGGRREEGRRGRREKNQKSRNFKMFT